MINDVLRSGVCLLPIFRYMYLVALHFSGVCFCDSTIFRILCELIFAIVKDLVFFLLSKFFHFW